MRRRIAAPAAVAVATVVLGACAGSAGDPAAGGGGDVGAPATAGVGRDDTTDTGAPERRFRYPAAPATPTADLAGPASAVDAIDRIVQGLRDGGLDTAAVETVGATGDPRHAWFLADLLRFFGGAEAATVVDAFERLTATSIDPDPDAARSPWVSVTNHLIAWDTPDYPGYRDDKSGVFLLVDPAWEPFFADVDAAIDWRHLSWGGVLIDDRESGDTRPCPGGCIPALDDPVVTDADGGDWYPDDRIVFGIVEGDEALAIPLHVAEVHEMFNLDLGGRRLGVPYCTLCGSAQAYYLDDLDRFGVVDTPVLRTSGLLNRSNKVMYDLRTRSVFDTFTGAAVSGPLQDADVVLGATSVVRSTWGAWKAAHPTTTIVAEDGGIGRSYRLDPLGGRDDDGPIFPIGSVDDRLGTQALVVGVIAPDGTAMAFPARAAGEALAAGGTVELGGVALARSGDGLVARNARTGAEVAAHEAFWFAWSQFHPDTLVWQP